MGKTKLISVDLDEQTLTYLKGKRDQVVAATRTLELSSQNVAWALKDFYSDYTAIMGDVTKLSEKEIAALQELNPKTLPYLSSVMAKCNENLQQPQHLIKGKRVRDPDMPKKPMTVFLAFSTDQRAVIRAERRAQGLPPLASSQMAAEVTEMWNNLPQERKDVYREEYLERLAEYRINKNKYLSKVYEVKQIALKTEPAAAAAVKPEVESSSEEEDEFADALENPEDVEDEEEEEEEEEEEVEEPPKKKRAKKNH